MGRYCSKSDVTRQYGVYNINEWADIDNDNVQADIDARIEDHCNAAADYIDARLKGTGYITPFTTVTNDIRYNAAKLAGVYIYEGKGADEESDDAGRPDHAYASRRKQVDDWLTNVRAGTIRLSADRYAGVTPFVVTSDRPYK